MKSLTFENFLLFNNGVTEIRVGEIPSKNQSSI